MIRTLIRTAALAVSLSAFSVQAAEVLTIDNQHSFVVWKIGHLDFSTQTGKWPVDGTLTIDKDKPENSKAEISIDLSKIITGIPELDKNIKGKEFFDVEKYPKATFVSEKVELTGKKTAKVTGMLNLHGVSKPVTLLVTLNADGVNPVSEKMTAGFSATGKIKRSDYGITAYLPALKDDVDLEINVEAVKP